MQCVRSTMMLAACLFAGVCLAQEQPFKPSPGPGMGQGPQGPHQPDRPSGPPRQARIEARIALPRPGGPGASVTIVAASPLGNDRVVTLREDIPVMLQILRKQLDKGYGQFQALDLIGIGQSPFQGIYIQGYGLLLLGRAVLAQGQDEGQRTTGSQQPTPSDPVWQQAMQEIGTIAGPIGMPGAGPPVSTGWREGELIEQMIHSLKHASNIRGMISEDMVTICVAGQAMATAATWGPPEGFVPGPAAASWGPENLSTLTVQAGFEDIRLLASGRLTFEQFRQKVRAVVY